MSISWHRARADLSIKREFTVGDCQANADAYSADAFESFDVIHDRFRLRGNCGT